VLRLLPSPTAWLMALGLAGLVWLVRGDGRWPIIAAPIFVAWFTVAMFFTQDRFRFLAVPMLAFCSGIWIDQIVRDIRDRRKWQVLGFAGLAAVIAGFSVYLGSRDTPAPVRWDQIAWGYIKMGKIDEARALAVRVAGEQPGNGAILEALGFTAIARQQYSEAVEDYGRAIKLRPRSHVAHYNLARALLVLGERKQAADEARIAAELHPSPDYQALLTQIEAGQ
jgi:tetratricopeptide (TPR) repeat protein